MPPMIAGIEIRIVKINKTTPIIDKTGIATAASDIEADTPVIAAAPPIKTQAIIPINKPIDPHTIWIIATILICPSMIRSISRYSIKFIRDDIHFISNNSDLIYLLIFMYSELQLVYDEI
jgi:hypothetical protein